MAIVRIQTTTPGPPGATAASGNGMCFRSFQEGLG